MRKILVITLGLVLFTGSAVSAEGDAFTYKDCTELRKIWKRGVAGTRAAARITGAMFEPEDFGANKSKDSDKDGAACEDAPRKIKTVKRYKIAPGANLKGANLKGANLKGANLIDANLTGANLSGVNLSGAWLDSANLSGANLSGANLCSLQCAILTGANLTGANLSGANLSAADLTGAILTGADLTGANLTRAKMPKT